MSYSIDDLRREAMQQSQAAMALNIAFIGVANHLFTVLAELSEASARELADKAGRDLGYVVRWCDAAYAFGYLDEVYDGRFCLTAKGHAFRPESAGTLMPFAVNSVLTAHMAERAAELMLTGERPGESVLGERATVLPWFGPMLEAMFGTFLCDCILPAVDAYQDVEERHGLAIDLGCGNGWYLRALARRYRGLHGIGLDGLDDNILHAQRAAQHDGVADRLQFIHGDIYQFNVTEQADLIAMNRALHHVWDQKEKVFLILKDHLKPGGHAVIWEPNWPLRRSELRDPARRPMAFQNLTEHVQGNHFLCPQEIAEQFEKVGLRTQIYLFADDKEQVVVGTKPDL